MMSSPSKDLFLGNHLNLEFTFPEFECVESTYTRKFDGGILIVAMSGITHLHSYASPSSLPPHLLHWLNCRLLV